ncbi:mitogen-activated protein kinase 7-like [Rhinopithecus roxellana]|uniref:mitogen-activated protein kinase 7-like n=1 Tax=Rhinopithecus roxellana TaxID=61622 RepID=UPI0012375B4B|nr:mitogen-activated protein kinase 7-like [Rhinopithecus roxellana]
MWGLGGKFRGDCGARPDAGCSRPNGCFSEPKVGDCRKEERRRRRRRARPGWDRSGGTLGGLCCARAALLGASASHTKGLASQSHRRPRGTVGSAQRGGAVAHPAPQPRSPAPGPPWPHPTPTAPSAAVPTPISATLTLPLGYFPPLSLCSPPYSRPVVEVTFLRSAAPEGREPTGSATPLHAVSGQRPRDSSRSKVEEPLAWEWTAWKSRPSLIFLSCLQSAPFRDSCPTGRFAKAEAALGTHKRPQGRTPYSAPGGPR